MPAAPVYAASKVNKRGVASAFACVKHHASVAPHTKGLSAWLGDEKRWNQLPVNTHVISGLRMFWVLMLVCT
jgi:hypothetical protein